MQYPLRKADQPTKEEHFLLRDQLQRSKIFVRNITSGGRNTDMTAESSSENSGRSRNLTIYCYILYIT
jgi:hypothetical protein